MIDRLRAWLLGGPKNLFDPRIHENLALIAIFAWIGLGSDGLSSSAYGPEEAFLHLGGHRYLAVFVGLAMVATIFLISASYIQIIGLFPSGGGGYVVATRLLGTGPGLISGCALVVDYVLTIAISVAAGCDAIFSLLPPGLSGAKPGVELAVVMGLILLNLRGIRESVVVLTPIFVAFMATHVALISWGILAQAPVFHHLAADTARDARSAIGELGLWGVLVVFLRAFSLGGGTFTGIEAVSNSTEILREPKVATGRRTMIYMACSLAFTAGGILLCYLLHDVRPQPGLTLNASLWDLLTRGWRVGGIDLGPPMVWLTLLSEGALLFVAAQTGFVAGPRTLGSMAVDSWVPKRLGHLSERLVTQNGVLFMGLAAAAVILYSAGSVKLLVVMYSINVFMTFTLTQAGMVRHWWLTRRAQARWRRRLGVALAGTAVTAGILAVTTVVKFGEGGWVTLVATGMLAALCWGVRWHYRRVRRMLRSLDEALVQLPLPDHGAAPEMSPEGPTAVVLVESYAGLGIHTLLSIQRLFPRHYRNIVFCSVGLVDSGRFKGVEALAALEDKLRGDLERYVELAERMGYYAEYRYTIGTDLIAELEGLCIPLTREFRRAVVFAGQLVFQRETLLTRTLHHETSFAIQRRLQFDGIQVVVLPIRVWERTKAA